MESVFYDYIQCLFNLSKSYNNYEYIRQTSGIIILERLHLETSLWLEIDELFDDFRY